MRYSSSVRAMLAAATVAAGSQFASAASWSNSAANQWWYNPANWGGALPVQGTANTGATHSINNGYSFSGEGVVFDPINDPYANGTISSASSTYVLGGAAADGSSANFNLYLASGNGAVSSKLTLKSGRIEFFDGTDMLALGRNDNTSGTTGVMVQTGGTLYIPNNNIDIGNLRNTSFISNGIYDFRGGTLTAGGTTTVNSPTQGGGIRLGVGNGSTGSFISRRESDGTATVWNYASAQGTGVGITEFHYNTGNVNPINVLNTLTLNNDGTAARRSHLNFLLDATPDSKGDNGTFYIPEDIGLINVDSDTNGAGNGVTGTANALFWNLAGDDSLVEGDTVSATFGGFTYNWQIQYHGDITGGTIAATGGKDVVLIGLSSNQPIPEPATLGVLALAASTALRRRRA